METSDADARDAHAVSVSASDPAVLEARLSGGTLWVRGVHRGAATLTATAIDDSGADNATSPPATLSLTVPNARPAVEPVAAVDVAVGGEAVVVPRVTDADAGDAHTLAAVPADPSVATVAVSGRRLTVAGVARGGTTVQVTAADDSGAANARSGRRRSRWRSRRGTGGPSWTPSAT